MFISDLDILLSMANIAQQRIQREFREVVKSKEIAESGVQLELVNDDLTELAGEEVTQTHNIDIMSTLLMSQVK